MPINITGSPYSNMQTVIPRSEHNYVYPEGLNLKPGSPTHEKLKRLVFDYANESYRVIQRRFDSWNKIDESLTAFIPADEEETEVLSNDSRKPVSIVIPYSYATLETILTYLLAAFAQEPVFRYEGTGPEDIIGAMLLEMCINTQCQQMKIALPLHTMWRDSLAYGLGVVAPVWKEKWGYKTEVYEEPLFSLFGLNVGKKPVRQMKEALLFEGNDLENIDPYRYLPDPNYGVHEVQKGEFVGWVETVPLMELLNRERRDEDVFNVKYLKEISSRRSALFKNDDSARGSRYGGTDRFAISESIAKPVDLIHMYVKLIPKDYNLKGGEFNPDGEYPEKWYFCLAADSVIIEARPLGLNHDMFPICVCAPDFDGRTSTPISRLELVDGLQTSLNFMFNSHQANARKALNDMLIVDPFLVNMNDLRDPQPGKLIRLRRSAWGKGVSDVVQQLKVTDVTANNINDARNIIDIMERVSAATHNLMGVMRPGSERRTATEFEGTQGSALNRLERIARIIGLQAMQDLGYMYASHTQQLMSQDVYLKITGETEKELVSMLGNKTQNGRIHITPYDLIINYDVLVKDGSVPGGNFSQAWVQIFQSIIQSDFAAGRIDIFKLFKYIARNLGAKNISDFELKQMPTEQVQQQVQEGNLVPMPNQEEVSMG